MRRVLVTEYDKQKKEYKGVKGKFHCWGSNYNEFESGPGNYTVGIIELDNGDIVQVEPPHIKFLDTYDKIEESEELGLEYKLPPHNNPQCKYYNPNF